MRPAQLYFIPFIGLLLIASCSGGGGGGGGQSEEAPPTTGGTSGGSTGGTSGGTTGGTSGGTSGGTGVDITYDSELTPQESQALTSSTKAMATYQIDGSRIKYFSQVFGGNRSSSVVNYVETRVNYALSGDTNYQDRLVPPPSLLRNLQVFAFNPSTSIWYDAKAAEPTDTKIRINNQLVDINSSRIGVMQFGDLYVGSPASLQAATIVHEARHSDCTGGALATDIDRHEQGLPKENKKCGHLHGVCPPGHIYAGQVACDLLPWGAYIMDAMYSVAIVETCTNCSEADLQAAEANALDCLERPAYSIEDLFNGALGAPDMSSSSTVR